MCPTRRAATLSLPAARLAAGHRSLLTQHVPGRPPYTPPPRHPTPGLAVTPSPRGHAWVGAGRCQGLSQTLRRPQVPPPNPWPGRVRAQQEARGSQDGRKKTEHRPAVGERGQEPRPKAPGPHGPQAGSEPSWGPWDGPPALSTSLVVCGRQYWGSRGGLASRSFLPSSWRLAASRSPGQPGRPPAAPAGSDPKGQGTAGA